MATYGKKASDKVEKTMHERKAGTLKSGSGKKVTSRKQAIAIGFAKNGIFEDSILSNTSFSRSGGIAEPSA